MMPILAKGDDVRSPAQESMGQKQDWNSGVPALISLTSITNVDYSREPIVSPSIHSIFPKRIGRTTGLCSSNKHKTP